MLIKDPYLQSNVKNRSFSNYAANSYNNPLNKNAQNTSTFQCENTNTQNIIHNTKYLSQPLNNQKRQRERFVSAYEPVNTNSSQDNSNIQILKNKLYEYQNQIKNLTENYQNQAKVFQKVNSYQAVNKQYHQAMKCRNYQLNTKVTDLQYEKALIHKRNQEQMLKNAFDKQNFIRKYEEQTQQIINSKRTINQLIEQKARLEQEVSHLMFLLQKDNHQGSLQIKEQLIRMENMERTLKGVINTKDQEIMQLRNRLRVYQDENKRLNDLSKTLAITTKDKIDNLSKIQNMDSNMKSLHKENFDPNHKNFDYLSELKEQKHVNQRLQNQINQLKKKLFSNPNEKETGLFSKKGIIQNHKQANQSQKNQIENGLNKLKQLRDFIVKQMFDLFCKSVKDGQRERRNSLVIFIENWKALDMDNLNKYIRQYMNERDRLKTQMKNKNISADPMLKSMIQECLPLKIAAKSRNQVNQWILSTIQLTKNQKYQSLMKSTGNSINKRNNSLLFLFRLLTIQYRVKYPMQGKGYTLDLDVKNQLHHTIVKALLDYPEK